MKGSLRPASPDGDGYIIVNVAELHKSLKYLSAELMEFLDYVLKQKTGQKVYKNGVRDKGRENATLGYFVKHDIARHAKLR